MKDGKIAVVEDEAERVRLIYRRYLELSGVNALVRDLRDEDLRTKIRLRATGATHGGILFERGSLFYLLRNRFYVGEVKYKGEILPGEQPVIMDRQLFDAVRQKLTDQWSHRNHAKTKSDHLLTGLLYDDAGHRMIPTHATKAGIRYRYYASLPHLKGESKTASVGSISRIPATDIEDIIVNSVNEHLVAQQDQPSSSRAHADDRGVIAAYHAIVDGGAWHHPGLQRAPMWLFPLGLPVERIHGGTARYGVPTGKGPISSGFTPSPRRRNHGPCPS
jgi:hypothetical protein